MTTTLKAIQALYVKIGGNLTDTYDAIANGAAVSNYTLLTDALKAVFVKCGGNLSTVYSDINSAPVSGYSLNPDVINAIAKVAQIPVEQSQE